LQDFVNVRHGDALAIAANKDWLNQEGFDYILEKKQLSRTTLVVPTIRSDPKNPYHSQLRIKIVDDEEYRVLKGKSLFEHLVVDQVDYLFGTEALCLRYTPGILVSHWEKDPKVTKMRLTYRFAKICLGVLGKGYGSRATAPCHGLSIFFKPEGRGTKATTVSPAQAKEEIEFQQYSRARDAGKQLCHPWIRAKMNELSNDVRDFARDVNPDLMKMVGRICTRQILTTGNVPEGSRIPTRGFMCSSHVDTVDRLSPIQVTEWRQTADSRRWRHCQKLLRHQDFCLPTTCGYQFVFDSEEAKRNLTPFAFFGMEGLGMAVQIEHGTAHHFMGAMFSHQTCLPVCRGPNGNFNANNNNNDFLIMAWGTSGGRREVAEVVAAVPVAETVVEQVETEADVLHAAGRISI
jgi:hypothetical protein